MAIELKNSVFVHNPKCGGRTIGKLLMKHVDGATILGEPHSVPETKKQTFGFVRHPATFLFSLWHHRASVNRKASQWNWQRHLRLEKECHDTDYVKFLDKVLDGKDYVYDYFMYYLGKYSNVQIGRLENLKEDLVGILIQNNENFNVDNILNTKVYKGARIKTNKNPTPLLATMDSDRLEKLVHVSEKKLCDMFGYVIN